MVRKKWTTATQLCARYAFMVRENGQRQHNCFPDTLLWTGKMDNGNTIAFPTRFYGLGKWIPGNCIMCRAIIRFYGPGKWTTATQLCARYVFMVRENGQRQRNCVPDTFLWSGKMDNGNAIGCLILFCGPGKWITATQLLDRYAFMGRGNG